MEGSFKDCIFTHIQSAKLHKKPLNIKDSIKLCSGVYFSAKKPDNIKLWVNTPKHLQKFTKHLHFNQNIQ